MSKGPGTVDGSKMARPATCIGADGVSIHRNPASSPVSRSIWWSSWLRSGGWYDHLHDQPPSVGAALTEPADLPLQEGAGGHREHGGVEEVVRGGALRWSGDQRVDTRDPVPEQRQG